jgi:hypothetical protein
MPDTVTFTGVCIEIINLYKNYLEEIEEFESYVPAANIVEVCKTVDTAFKKRISTTVRRYGYVSVLEFFYEVQKRTNTTFAAMHYGWLIPLVEPLLLDREFNQTMSLLAETNMNDQLVSN